MSHPPQPDRPIIFYDGKCGLCNRFVSLILRTDTGGRFLFAPLQGTTARALLPPLSNDPREWSMLYLDETGLHDQSDASLEVYRRLGGCWGVLGWARFVPAFVRTPIYRVVARNRYRWFGQLEVCRIPTREEQARFLP